MLMHKVFPDSRDIFPKILAIKGTDYFWTWLNYEENIFYILATSFLQTDSYKANKIYIIFRLLQIHLVD